MADSVKNKAKIAKQSLDEMLRSDERNGALQARALEHEVEAVRIEEERQYEFNERMRR